MPCPEFLVNFKKKLKMLPQKKKKKKRRGTRYSVQSGVSEFY